MGIKKFWILAIFIAALGLFYYFDLHHFLTMDSLRSNRAFLSDFYRTHPYTTITAFILVYALQTALFLPADIFLSLLAGALFGVVMGTVFVNVGATAGATLGFLAVRYVFRDAVQKRAGGKLGAINSALEKNGFRYLIVLRLIPIFPFVLITLGTALTKMPVRIFTLGTMIGIIPGSILFCNAGSSLATIDSADDIMSPRVVLSLAILGLFSLLPLLYRKVKQGHKGNGEY